MKSAHLSLLALGGLLLLGNAQADEALAKAKNCMSCHQVAVKVLGPAYKDVAAKYKGDAGAVDKLAAKIKAGGKGVWGEIPMPPTTSPPTKPRSWRPGSSP